jgi:PTH2 family peptidyl-tRNA hydrolase
VDVKQVLVIRKDLKMRRGKEIAQGAHASMAWLTNRLRASGEAKAGT